LIDIYDASIAVVGMGGVGSSAYDEMYRQHGKTVIGVDIDPVTVKNHINAGRHVLHGDPSDADFWGRIQSRHKLKMVMLALPKLSTALAVARQLNTLAFDGQVAATSKFQDEVETLEQAGVTVVFNVYTEAGSGFAAHVSANLSKTR
jgi:glutathione-regulated potassium-efflux system ancillary protein KefC